jgi:hypothetical protein
MKAKLLSSGLASARARQPHHDQQSARVTMQKPKHTAVGNIYFLSRIGESLRWATQDIVRDDLPADIQHLLNRLDRREAIGEMDDPASCEARLSHPANDRSGNA